MASALPIGSPNRSKCGLNAVCGRRNQAPQRSFSAAENAIRKNKNILLCRRCKAPHINDASGTVKITDMERLEDYLNQASRQSTRAEYHATRCERQSYASCRPIQLERRQLSADRDRRTRGIDCHGGVLFRLHLRSVAPLHTRDRGAQCYEHSGSVADPYRPGTIFPQPGHGEA